MTVPDARPDTRRTIDAVWRIESARLIAGLARFTGDIGGDLPRLVFTTCLPILSQEARVALTLQLQAA
jgi:predicted RNA polymerase sigma factor